MGQLFAKFGRPGHDSESLMANYTDGESLIDAVRRHVSMLPKHAKLPDGLEVRLRELADLVTLMRPPRIVVFGGCGEGKSSLTNAIVGCRNAESNAVFRGTRIPTWHNAGTKRYGYIELLDTRGMCDNELQPAEAMQHIAVALARKPADVVLFVISFDTVRNCSINVMKLIESLVNVCNFVENKNLVVIPVLTMCDNVEPIDAPLTQPIYRQLVENLAMLEAELAREDTPLGKHLLAEAVKLARAKVDGFKELRLKLEQKQQNIKGAIEQLQQRLAKFAQGQAFHFLKPVPVSSYIAWNADGTMQLDGRWNIELLVGKICENIPAETKIAIARASHLPFVQVLICRGYVSYYSVICGGVAKIQGFEEPEKVDCSMVVSNLHWLMLRVVAQIGGVDTSSDAFLRMFATALGLPPDFNFVWWNVPPSSAPKSPLALLSDLARARGAISMEQLTESLGRAAESYFVHGERATERLVAFFGSESFQSLSIS